MRATVPSALPCKYFVLELGEVVTLHLKKSSLPGYLQLHSVFEVSLNCKTLSPKRKTLRKRRWWRRESGREERKEESENTSHKPRSFLSKHGLSVSGWFAHSHVIQPRSLACVHWGCEVKATRMSTCRMAASIPDITGPAHGDLHDHSLLSWVFTWYFLL